jgi:hypothetical protein
MKRFLNVLRRRSAHSKALLFLLLSLGILVMPSKAAAQQDLVDDEGVDVSDFCDIEFDCALESVAVIFDTTSPSHLDVLSETDVNLDAQDDGWAAYDCGSAFEDDEFLDGGCADDDGSGTAALDGSIPINAIQSTHLYSLFTDSYLADVLDDDFACDDEDPDFCFAIVTTGIEFLPIGPIKVNTVSPLFITVGTSGTLTITGENLSNPFGGPPSNMQTHHVGGTGSGFTISTPSFGPDGSGGTAPYQADQNATVGQWTVGVSYTMGDTVLSSTNVGSLTIGYPPASITNVTPQPWVGGQSNLNVTITGQNFGTNPTLTISGAGVTLVSFTPNLNGQSISATVNIDLNAPSGSALIDVAPGYNQPFVCACAGSGHGISSANVQAAIAPSPQIIFNGNNVAGTTQSVFAGQQIALTGIPPVGFSVASASWSSLSPQNMVGGYGNGLGGPPDPRGGHPLPTPSTNCPASGNCNFTYYYVSAGTDTLALTYTLSNGTTSSATVTFNVTGPGGNILPNAFLQPDSTGVVLTNATNGAAFMQMGNAPTAPSVGVSINDNVSLPRGNVIWVQILQSTTFTQIFDPSGGVIPPSNLGLGLDGGYPYPPRFVSLTGPNTATDAPGRFLSSSMGQGTDTFDAIMYAMWDPAIPAGGQGSCTTAHVDTTTTPYTYIASTCASIPVPLGSVEWKWSACAVNHGAGSTPNWGVQCGAGKALTPVITDFPQWSTCDSSQNANCQPL